MNKRIQRGSQCSDQKFIIFLIVKRMASCRCRVQHLQKEVIDPVFAGISYKRRNSVTCFFHGLNQQVVIITLHLFALLKVFRIS